jgi:hydroxymethylpyrimidine kinase/phosphomethylpyrimidine kinase
MGSRTVSLPWVVLVGGIDPGGGAGLLRDVATATALGARPYAVGTAWTDQGDGIHRVEPRSPEAVGAALAWALGTIRPVAVKIGMAVGPGTAAALIEALADFAGPVVVDPVLASSRGGPLWGGAPRELLPLLRRATLATPNAVEAVALTGRPIATIAEAEAAGRRLAEHEDLSAVLVKGGHLAGENADPVTDVLVTRTSALRYPHPRLAGPSPRGTGCALATAIAIALGRGRPLGEAVQAGVDWLSAAMAAATTAGRERHLP